MDVLPTEMIEAIGQFLDFHSAARFAFTCRTAYAVAHPYISKMVKTRKSICDEVLTIKYEVCERDESVRCDISGDLCSVRTYACGRIVGALHCTAYEPGLLITVESTVFFSDHIIMSELNRNRSSNKRRQVGVRCRYLHISYGEFTHEDVIGMSYNNVGQYDDYSVITYDCVSIREKSPIIVAGELQWKKCNSTVKVKNLTWPI